MSKLKEVAVSVAPITAIVIILHFTLTPIPAGSFERFIIGAIFILIGLSIFLFGIDVGITTIGVNIGSTISKSNKVLVVVILGFLLGFFINISEPDLQILAHRVATVTGGDISMFSILIVVSIGIGLMLVFGFLRIVFNFSIKKLLLISYAIIFILTIFSSESFMAIAFDSSGATTGALTVPFIMALALGISSLRKDSITSQSDSFGLVGVASSGAILGVLLLGIISRQESISVVLESDISHQTYLFEPFLYELSVMWRESLISMAPLVVIFLVFQFVSFRLPRRQFRRIVIGLVYTYVGLVIFLIGVNAGFMDVGEIIGRKIASLDSKVYAVLVGFVIGFVTILSEPAVLVLTHQIEDVTSGYIKRRVVFGALTIGVGIAVALAIARIVVPGMRLWHILLPGYIIVFVLTFFVKKLFVGIAFDSGGVATGPMTATFILAYSQGVAGESVNSDLLSSAFGMITLVAMTPIITLQILGLIFQLKARKSKKVGDEANA